MFSSPIPGLALDIDGTLSQTTHYWVAYLMEHCGNPEGLSVEEMIAKYPYTQNVPYWQTPEGNATMDMLATTGEHYTNLPLIENAATHTRRIHETWPIIAYITARPDSIAPHTKIWLDKHDFPVAEIITRPDDVPLAEGNSWKAKILEELYPTVVGIVDDNPSLIKNLSADYQGTIYLFGGSVSPETRVKVVTCGRWEDVRREICGE